MSSPGEVIFRKGESSRELFFLLQGEVDVMSSSDAGAVHSRLTPREEIFVAANKNRGPGEPELSISHAGCFGESVIYGHRRKHTHVAYNFVETLALSKQNLVAVFEKNPEWTGPAPGFDRVVCHVITEVQAAELAYEAGEIDCTELGPDSLARYSENMPEGTEITTAGELQYMWMGMNTQHPKLQDIRVRKAIQHAVDVDSILAGAFAGTSAKSHGIVCPGLLGHRSETSYSYDPAKARELLAEAGVSGLELTLRTLNWQERLLTAQIIQANLAAIGITVKILPMESGPFWEMGMESAGDTWQDLELWIMRFATVPDPYEATQWFVSEQVGVWNWERWTDPEFDRLYEAGLSETDLAKREEIYLQMQQIMEDTGAYVWINHEPEVYAHRTDIEVVAAPSGELNYHRFKPL